jgi:Gram-negative porin
MKKTLVAIAVLASAGAASAQYTLSGGYTFGYKATDVNGVSASGFGNDGASIKLTAVEDLGNGLTATASISAGGLARAANSATGGFVDGENANMALAGGFGTVTLATNEGSVSLSGWQGPASAFDGKVLSANSVRDSVSYTLPKFGDFTVGLGYTEDSDAGLGYGASGADKSFSGYVAYASGPLSGRVLYAMYKESVYDNAYNIRASYNAGVVTVGAGFAQLNGDSGQRRDYVVGGNIPMGAVTLGLNYASREQMTGRKDKGTSLGVSYALSKSTGVNFATTSWKQGSGTNNTESTLTISKSF